MVLQVNQLPDNGCLPWRKNDAYGKNQKNYRVDLVARRLSARIRRKNLEVVEKQTTFVT
jgi:hypothetical protein